MNPPDIDARRRGRLRVLQEIVHRVPGGCLVDGDFQSDFVADEKFLETHSGGERVGAVGEEVGVGAADTADVPESVLMFAYHDFEVFIDLGRS